MKKVCRLSFRFSRFPERPLWKMKGKLFSYMAVAAVLCSCSRGGDVTVPADRGISFYVSAPPAPRATKSYSEATEQTLRAEGFNVAAVDSGGSLMFLRHAVFSGGAWQPEGGPYWWPAGRVTFCGVYPCGLRMTVSSGDVTADYVHAPGTDMLASCAVTARREGSVPLTFTHALSLIRFEGVSTDPAFRVKVRSVSVKVPSSGTYRFATGTWTPGGATVGETYSSTLTELPQDGTPAPIAGAVTAIPCSPSVTVEWDSYSADGKIFIASHKDTKSISPSLEKGRECLVTMRFSEKSAQQITFSVSIRPWEHIHHKIDIK